MSEWTKIFLGEHCKIRTGKKDVNEGSPSGEYPFFTCSRDISWSDYYSFDTEAVLIAGNGDVGNLHYYNGKFEAYQRTYVLDNFRLNIHYIRQYLKAFLLKALEKEKIGTSIPYIKLEHLSLLPIHLPVESREQQKIATILTSIDTAIEKTEALIEKYQQIKSGLMHDLFTRGVLPNGQLRPTREQAPELYQETKIGWIPKEWECGYLKRYLISPPKNGYSPNEIDYWDGIYVLGLGCLTKNGFNPKQLKKVNYKAAISSGAILNDGDILISRANTPELVGLCGIYKDIGEKVIYPDLMMRISLSSTLDKFYFEQLMLHSSTRNQIKALAVGTSSSMVKLNSTSLKKLIIKAPSPKEQMRIVETIRPFENQLVALTLQLKKLQSQKLGLMQDLLTGKVPVTVSENADQEEAHA